MYNLYIVASPLQFINALEAKHKFNTQNDILLLMYNTKENIRDFQQKNDLLNTDEWSQIIHYNLATIPKYFRFFHQIKLIKSLQKLNFNYIFSGEFGIFQQSLLANLKTNNIFLLDDGTATIFIYQQLKEKNYFSKLSLDKKIRLLRYRLVNLKFIIQQNINFLTIFNIPSTSHIKVIQHSFSYLKANKLKQCKLNVTTFVLGQNLVDNHWMTQEKYIQYLKKIILYSKENIIYIPHRSEQITDAYDILINEKFQIQKSNGPVETLFIEQCIYPKTIISFTSSALFTLDKIFSEATIYSVVIDPSDLSINKQVVQECYNFFNNTNVKLIDKI